jgi:hypothetical protein
LAKRLFAGVVLGGCDMALPAGRSGKYLSVLSIVDRYGFEVSRGLHDRLDIDA